MTTVRSAVAAAQHGDPDLLRRRDPRRRHRPDRRRGEGDPGDAVPAFPRQGRPDRQLSAGSRPGHPRPGGGDRGRRSAGARDPPGHRQVHRGRHQVPGFRGCAFLNAAAEYPDPAHPVHKAVLAHRQWFSHTITEVLAQIGDAPAEPAARHVVMLRDGAMATGCLSDPEPICETFLQGVESLLQLHTAASKLV